MTASDPSPSDALAVVRAFDEAWNAHDLEAVLALTTEDCAFESARAGVHGDRLVGREALRAAWGPGFAAAAASPNPAAAAMRFEDVFTAGDRVVQLWVYGEGDSAVRGVDVMRVRDGRVAEKFGYVKVR